MTHDIIGDIHGHVDRLTALLRTLGYRESGGAWRHPSRKAIFVGDLIDRGPGQLATLALVRAMVDAGAARVVMGNHEFNAIAWATPDPKNDGHHLRARLGEKGEKNRRQTAAFLSEVGEDSEEHRRWIAWFYELPLFLEEPSFQVVHACWSPAHIARLRPRLAKGNCLTPALVEEASRKGTPAYEAIETLAKGLEVKLPAGSFMRDKEGHVRHEMRTRWWDPNAATYRAAYMGPPADIPDLPIEANVRVPAPARPTFIGHYWLDRKRDGLAPLAPRVVCVDYSVANGGPLVAYRFDGETELRAEKFVAV